MRAWLLGAAWLLVASGCPTPSTAGATCAKHEDCQALPEGYCAKAGVCTRLCEESVPCPATSTCATADGRRVCLVSCSADADCAHGYRCGDAPEGRVCLLPDPLQPLPAAK